MTLVEQAEGGLVRDPLAEEVLVVRRDDIFALGVWEGLKTEGFSIEEEVMRHRSFFMARSLVEEDPSFQQIIPYLVFHYQGLYLLTRRLKGSSEHRLRQLYSIGVGGHVNPTDVSGGDPIQAGLEREWEEEVEYSGGFRLRPLGLLHDESAQVSQVHLGVVFLVEGNSPEIRVRETHKLSGELLTLDQMRIHYDEMESWSQIVYDHLRGM